MRRKTRKVYVGNVPVGGDAPIAVQSMNTTYTRDVKSTVAQIHRLQDVGCEIARVAVPEMEDALVIGEIIKQIKIPLVADIHYDPALAMEARSEERRVGKECRYRWWECSMKEK